MTRSLAGVHLITPAMVALVVISAAMAGSFVGHQSVFALVPVVVVTFIMLVQSARLRLIFLIFGGLVTLQGSQELDATKIMYVLGAAFALALALLRLRGLPLAPWYTALRPLLFISLLWIVVVTLSFFAAAANDVPFSAWLRGVIPYLLFASIPVFVNDVMLSRSQQLVTGLFLVTGTLTAISFFVAWISRRGYADLSIERLAFWSLLLPAALYCYAVSSAVREKRRLGWILLGALILGLSLGTGTRTALVLLFVPVVMLFGGRGGRIGRVTRATLVMLAMLALLGGFFQLLGWTTGVDTGRLMERLQSVTGIFSDEVAGQSFESRRAQTLVVWEAFRQSPLLGVGPGNTFVWTTAIGGTKSGPAVDTPLAIAADFGIIGVIVALYAIAQYAIIIFRLGRGLSHPVYAAARGFLFFTIFLMTLGSPFQDKGFSFALLLLLLMALYARDIKDHSSTLAPQDFTATASAVHTSAVRGLPRAGISPNPARS